MIAEMYAYGLAVRGYEVHIATSRDRAMYEAARRRPVGVIVLDLEIRTTRGLTILDELRHREATADVPVIVLSDDDLESAEAERHGANETHRKYRTTPKELVGYVERSFTGAA